MFRLIIILLFSIAQIEAKYPLSICTIFQDEAPFLKEWIEFHKLQGVKHFYLYNNNSKDNYKSVLQPYIHSTEVTLIDWPYTYPPGEADKWLSIQRGAYKHCLKKYGKDTSWLAVIDTDEFLFCPNGEKLTAFLKRYTRYGGVCVNWLLFGTSNVQNIPQGSLMIELLTKCSYPDHPRNARVKSIVQPRYVANCKTAHSFSYKGTFAVNAKGKRINNLNSHNIIHDKIRINHYWTRTEEHFEEKKSKSRQNRREEDDEEKMKSWADSYNKSEDTAILLFVPALRKKMGLSVTPDVGVR